MDLHGGNVYRYERVGKHLLDYSSNINPLGLPRKVREKLVQHMELLEKYPDTEYIELRENIAKKENLTLEEVIVGNGATEILFLYIRACQAKKALLVSPCFAEYERACKSVDCEVVYFPLKEEEESFYFSFEKLEEMLEKENFDLFILCNPNNPTSKFFDLEEIKKVNELLEEKKIRFFIDEAFIDFLENYEEKTAISCKNSNIFVLRAMTKFFAVPGLRLGYGLTHDRELLKKMWNLKEPWSVNQLAVLAGSLFFEEEEYIHKTKQWIKEEKKYFFEALRREKKLKVFRPSCNFILCKLLTMDVKVFYEKMIEKGILVRDATNFPSLEGQFFRLAIKDRQHNQEVLCAIERVLEKGEV